METTIDFSQIKIKDLVTENFHTAELFEKLGIDYCCNGDRILKTALDEKNISSSKFLSELEKVKNSSLIEYQKYSEWDLDFLTQYIIENHHKYVKNAIPNISNHLQKVFEAHGEKHSFIVNVQKIFFEVAEELTQHMMKEERILFPIIKYLADSQKLREKPKTRGYVTIQNPIRQMEAEHISAGNALENIRRLTNNYTLPEDSCATFEITYKELEKFEKDLHKHVHLENNILFPKAIELEERLIKEIYD